jgi:hypothetical protein
LTLIPLDLFDSSDSRITVSVWHPSQFALSQQFPLI